MTERGHLLILVEGFYPQTGGGANTQWEIAKTASSGGYQVSVFTPRLSDTPKFERVQDVDIHRPFPGAPDPNDPNSIPGILWRLLFNLSTLTYLMGWCWRREPDIIYSPSHLTHSIAAILSRLFQIPVVNFVAYSPVLRDEEIGRWDVRRIFERVNFRYFMGDVVFSRTPRVNEILKQRSNSTVRQAHGVLNEKDLESIPMRVNRNSVLEEFGIPQESRVLSWVGRMVPIKQPELAFKILGELPDDFHLIIVGDGPMLEETKSAVPRELEGHVHFTGLLPHPDTLNVISTSDALLLTSETEAYPTVVFEALALNTPVFSTPVGVLTTLSEDGLYVYGEDELSSHIVNVEQRSKVGLNSDIIHRYSIGQLSSEVTEEANRLVESARQK